MNTDGDCSDAGHHLIRFLELYGCQFNYLRTGIRIRDGGSYFRKNDGQAGEFENRYQYSLLCIEDPLNAGCPLCSVPNSRIDCYVLKILSTQVVRCALFPVAELTVMC